MSVVRQRQYAARVLAPCPYQIGDSVNQRLRLARTGARENQRVRLLTVVRHDAPLQGVVEAFDDYAPRFRRRRPANLSFPVWQPSTQKFVSPKQEVVQGESERVGHRAKPSLHVLRHDVNLHYLLVVVELEGGEVAWTNLRLSGFSRMVIAGRSAANPLFRRMTSCS